MDGWRLLNFSSLTLSMKKISFLIFYFILYSFYSPAVFGEDKAPIQDSIVKIYTIYTRPNYYNPWMMESTNQSSGSGAIISGKRILTNAHVVSHQTFIQVRKHGDSQKFKAHVISVSHDADLALLGVDDESFFQNTQPLGFGDLPPPQAEVSVYGFPIGGDSLSITKGVLSRIEHQRYVHSGFQFLAGQIDAAINPGNSGGPVIANNQIVGVVMQGLNNADNIGYMVPVSIIKHFLDDMKDGTYGGFPSTGLIIQKMENPDLRKKFKMQDTQSGILVLDIIAGSPAEGLFEKNDVLLAIEGHPLANDGTIEFRPKQRTSATYYIESKQMGGSITIDVLRNGEIKKVVLPLAQKINNQWLVSQEEYDTLPSYYIYGGVVFSKLTINYLKMWGKNWQKEAPIDLLEKTSSWPTADQKEIVLAVQVLPDEVNTGYHEINSWMMETVNDKPFKDFGEFVKILESQKGEPFMVFKDSKGQLVVLDNKKAQESHQRILETYRIQKDRSEDL